MKRFLLGELRFYTRLVIVTALTILLLQYWIVPAIAQWGDNQRTAVVHSVTEAPHSLLDKLREKAGL